MKVTQHTHTHTNSKGVNVILHLYRKQHRLCQHQHGDAPFKEGMLGDVIHLGAETTVFWERQRHRLGVTAPGWGGQQSRSLFLRALPEKQLWFSEVPR